MVAESLRTFIRDKMRMAQIYQPVMLRTLLRNQGRASERSIAKEILQHDESQIEYYENTVRDMVGRVLRNHGLVERDRKTKQWPHNGALPDIGLGLTSPHGGDYLEIEEWINGRNSTRASRHGSAW